jgi:hypothetical protein
MKWLTTIFSFCLDNERFKWWQWKMKWIRGSNLLTRSIHPSVKRYTIQRRMRHRMGGGISKDLSTDYRVVDRVQGFFSSPELGPPAPSTAGECVPLPLVPGGDTLTCVWGGGGSQFRWGDRHCGTLGIYIICRPKVFSTQKRFHLSGQLEK